MCVTVPSFVTIGQTFAELRQFNRFQYGGRLPSWFFIKKDQISNGQYRVKGINLRHPAKFRGDRRLNRC